MGLLISLDGLTDVGDGVAVILVAAVREVQSGNVHPQVGKIKVNVLSLFCCKVSREEKVNSFTYFLLLLSMQTLSTNSCILLTVRPDWAIYWSLGKFLKPLATINLGTQKGEVLL